MTPPLLALAAALAAAALAPLAAAQPSDVPRVYVYGTTTGEFDRFGFATALLDGGQTLLVGAENDYDQNPNVQGRVYVFERATPEAPWVQAAFWLPPPPATGSSGPPSPWRPATASSWSGHRGQAES